MGAMTAIETGGRFTRADVLVIDPRIVIEDTLTAYRDAGVPSYWVVDPLVPRLRVWALEDAHYVEVADVSGAEEWTGTAPYAVTVRPADLGRG
jgi:hypothetical protein